LVSETKIEKIRKGKRDRKGNEERKRKECSKNDNNIKSTKKKEFVLKWRKRKCFV
jgi:hypothetical protein